MAEAQDFIRRNLRLLPVPSVPEISLYTAHPQSGLWRLLGRDSETAPYWAYHWAGGTVLARYILDLPDTVMGKRVVDLGTGSGIVGIAAVKGDAAHVTAIDIDPIAVAAAFVNAEANSASIEVVCGDILDQAPPSVDLILVGDLFYNAPLAKRVLAFLRQCRRAGIDVLIGDPGRATLPRPELRLMAEYEVGDFGDSGHVMPKPCGVYRLAPAGNGCTE